MDAQASGRRAVPERQAGAAERRERSRLPEGTRSRRPLMAAGQSLSPQGWEGGRALSEQGEGEGPLLSLALYGGSSCIERTFRGTHQAVLSDSAILQMKRPKPKEGNSWSQGEMAEQRLGPWCPDPFSSSVPSTGLLQLKGFFLGCFTNMIPGCYRDLSD